MHEKKAQILFDHYKLLMGTNVEASVDLQWDNMGLQERNLSHLDARFTMQELKQVIDDMHGEKAPGPDGFIGSFYKSNWNLIKVDLLAAMNHMHCLKGKHWHLLNSANVVLLPKKEGAVDAKDYRPISLMHSAAKILCKLLATRLAPELEYLISRGQSAFVKGRSIHENFLYVRNVIKQAKTKKIPLIFLKLDIAKAFDSVHWGFLFKVLTKLGFGQRWRNMLALILASSSSRILLNGSPGKAFSHRRGLRQGDPLSPMLFIRVLEPLLKLLELATENQVLSPLRLGTARMRASFYADDAALLVNPLKEDITAIQRILSLFGDVSGLRTSFQKCVAYPVSCEGMNLEEILQDFGGTRGVFPCRYLGLPLSFRKPKKIEVQPLLDRAQGRLKGWKGKLLDRKSTRLNSSHITRSRMPSSA